MLKFVLAHFFVAVLLIVLFIAFAFYSLGAANLLLSHPFALTAFTVGICLLGILSGIYLLSNSLSKAIKKMSGQGPDTASPAIKNTPGGTVIDLLNDTIQAAQDGKVQLEREIGELRERYGLVTTNIAASLIIYAADGRVVFCSPYTQVLTGYSPEEIEAFSADGSDFLENLVTEQDLERYRRARQVSQLGEDILVRYRICHRSSLKLWLETRMVPVCDDDGEVASVLAVTVDVTDTLTYQEQIEAQNRDLNDFAYMVSHDLKAPIFTIKGMAGALVEDYHEQLGAGGRELLDYIIGGATRLEQLVASVIEYSSISTKEWQNTDVDLNTVLAQVCADLAEQIRAKQAALTVSVDLPAVHGDQIRIYQIFSNLLGNALKYSSPARIPEIKVKASKGPVDSVIVEVSDNGLGIPAAKLDDIFRPYRRAHGNEIEGSGIGLACVKKIVDRLGGTVTVASVEGQGSTFTVTFPPAQPNPRAVPADLARIF